MGKLFGVDNANSLNMQNRYDIEIDKDTTDLKSWQQAAASIATLVTEPRHQVGTYGAADLRSCPTTSGCDSS